jgi:hypothetical protein
VKKRVRERQNENEERRREGVRKRSNSPVRRPNVLSWESDESGNEPRKAGSEEEELSRRSSCGKRGCRRKEDGPVSGWELAGGAARITERPKDWTSASPQAVTSTTQVRVGSTLGTVSNLI